MEMFDPVLLVLFFAVAAVYAAAGFGGGSSYLALLVVWGIPFQNVKPTALLCNLVVVTGGCFLFYRKGYVHWRALLPLLLTGIPMAFLGAYWRIGDKATLTVLGIALLLAGGSLWLPEPKTGVAPEVKPEPTLWHYLLGAGTGLLSGMVGIGGGIFLAPILYQTRWGGARYIAAACSVFIFVNSLAGLGGHFARARDLPMYFALPLMGAVLLGGQLGSRWALRQSVGLVLRRITGVLVAYAGINVLMNV
jgi:uncharacterized membrane protein YfcA